MSLISMFSHCIEDELYSYLNLNNHFQKSEFGQTSQFSLCKDNLEDDGDHFTEQTAIYEH